MEIAKLPAKRGRGLTIAYQPAPIKTHVPPAAPLLAVQELIGDPDIAYRLIADILKVDLVVEPLVAIPVVEFLHSQVGSGWVKLLNPNVFIVFVRVLPRQSDNLYPVFEHCVR